MTGDMSDYKATDVNWRNLEVASALAIRAGATTAMLTGKGEPTLYPDLITEYLDKLQGKFPLVELQTNGLLFQANNKAKIDLDTLQLWYNLGLTTIAVSVCHYDSKKNAEIYLGDSNKEYPSLEKTISILHSVGFSVRICCVGIRGFIYSPDTLRDMAIMARRIKAEQLTYIPVNAPSQMQSDKDLLVADWVKHNRIEDYNSIIDFFDRNYGRIMELEHGAIVYDADGQNVCLSNCLPQKPSDIENMRNLIFFNDGHLRYKWDKKGSIIL
jgi:hypothetical protein